MGNIERQQVHKLVFQVPTHWNAKNVFFISVSNAFCNRSHMLTNNDAHSARLAHRARKAVLMRLNRLCTSSINFLFGFFEQELNETAIKSKKRIWGKKAGHNPEMSQVPRKINNISVCGVCLSHKIRVNNWSNLLFGCVFSYAMVYFIANCLLFCCVFYTSDCVCFMFHSVRFLPLRRSNHFLTCLVWAQWKIDYLLFLYIDLAQTK